MNLKTYLYRGNDEEFYVRVDYDYFPASTGARDSICGKRNNGPQLEPDESAHIEILFVTNIDTNEQIELTEEEEDIITQEIIDQIDDDDEDDEDDDEHERGCYR